MTPVVTSFSWTFLLLIWSCRTSCPSFNHVFSEVLTKCRIMGQLAGLLPLSLAQSALLAQGGGRAGTLSWHQHFKASKDFPPITQGRNKASGWAEIESGLCLLTVAGVGVLALGAEMGSGKWMGGWGSHGGWAGQSDLALTPFHTLHYP